jgi:hypothetical protein
MEYRYDVTQFSWNKDTNSFYGDAPHLVHFNPDGSIHPYAFPNMKEQFFIDNHKTGGFRRFRFVREITAEFDGIEFIEWLYESEDGIECRIAIN